MLASPEKPKRGGGVGVGKMPGLTLAPGDSDLTGAGARPPCGEF